MRFYKNKQALMLDNVARFLDEKRDILSSAVPAMKDFIDEFIKMEKAVHKVRTGNPHKVTQSALEKQSIKKEFIKAVSNLIAVLNAAGFKVKGKPLTEMHY